MKIEISGNYCVGCYKFTQYYMVDITTGAIVPTNCGFCGMFQRTTRPGSRCKRYREASNVGCALRRRRIDE